MEQKYKLAVCRTREEFDKKQEYFKDFDIVYKIDRNAIYTGHIITIYKQPKDIDDWYLAYEIDGFFWNVYRYGDELHCYYS